MNQFITYQRFGTGPCADPLRDQLHRHLDLGQKSPGNPWEATTLEWNDTTSPPPHGNFAKVPVVHHGPYEYSSPLVEEDWLPQTRFVEGANSAARHH